MASSCKTKQDGTSILYSAQYTAPSNSNEVILSPSQESLFCCRHQRGSQLPRQLRRAFGRCALHTFQQTSVLPCDHASKQAQHRPACRCVCLLTLCTKLHALLMYSTCVQTTAAAKPKNPLFEPSPKTFGVGNIPKPVKDLTRFVKWPKYIRTQRQLRVLRIRLKVPPGTVSNQPRTDCSLV